MNAAESAAIMSQLQAIRDDLSYIKEHMVDADTLLTPEEEARLEESLEEYRQGKTTPLSEVKQELGLADV